MKILFVDDEHLVLDAIQRSLYHVEGWELECATSGAEALEILEEDAFDVLVSDMRMPGMDGAELLTKVHELYPDTIRMVLSGHAEQEAAMRTIGVAHQFLAKPCAPGTLQTAIERTLQLQRLLASPAVQNLVGRVPALPSPPKIYMELTRLMTKEDVDLREVAALVETDPALCAKLLQVVNSAFFVQSARTSEVHQAVVRLGLLTLKGLVISLEAMGKFEIADAIAGFSFDDERQRAAKVARLSFQLCSTKAARADAFMAATLHDIGKWVLAAEAPDLLRDALAVAAERGRPLHEVEMEVYGATHAEVGAYLLGLWSLPEAVVAGVANHHSPERVLAHADELDVAHAVYIADAALFGVPPTDAQLASMRCKLSAAQLMEKAEAL